MNNEKSREEILAEIHRLLDEEEQLEEELGNVFMKGYAIGVSAQAKADRR